MWDMLGSPECFLALWYIEGLQCSKGELLFFLGGGTLCSFRCLPAPVYVPAIEGRCNEGESCCNRLRMYVLISTKERHIRIVGISEQALVIIVGALTEK